MANKLVFTDESLSTFVDEIKAYTDESSSGRATNGHGIYYGTCDTAAATVAKVVTLADSTGFSLTTGAVVIVKFTNANSASNPTLNVNSTGAKSIYRYGTTAASTSASTSGWRAGAVQIFVYDGSGWIRDFWENSTYSNVSLGQGYATCSTAASTTAKVGTLSSYAISTGGIVSVKFTYAVPASATLNINSKGAKAIYYRGAAITANVIEAGDIATFMYDGTQYQLLSIDRWQVDIDALQASVDTISDEVDGSIKGLSVSGKTITYTKNDGTTGTITTQDTNTTYSAGTGISLSGTTFSNSGVRSVATGSANGTISVNTNGTSADVAVKGLGSAAYTASTAYDASGTAQTKADSALASAKSYTDEKIALLMNNSSEAVDSIMELATAMEENADVVEALETAIGTKANASHTHGNITNAGAIGSTANKAVITTTNGVLTTGTVPVASGGTGATTAAAALTNLGITATAAELNKLDGVTATTAELNYVDGVTSNIQTQLDGKQATISGAASTIASSNLTASRALVSNSSGKVAVSAVTSTELGYLDGVTSSIQTQLDAKVPTSRTVNGKALSSNITLSASDVSAYSKTEIDNMVFITVEDIDTICGASIQAASLTNGVSF